MVTLHEVITFLVSMQISISSLQTHNVNRCDRCRNLARKLSLRSKRIISINDTATTEIYTLSLHDALPIWQTGTGVDLQQTATDLQLRDLTVRRKDRKSTRLNSSHLVISYAVFCLKENRCGRSRHLARKLSLRRKRSRPNVIVMAATATITS